MRTKITDNRKITRTNTVVIDGYVKDGKPLEDVTAETDGYHVDTRKLFIYFDDGEVDDWEKNRIVYGSSYSTKSREVTDRWRPTWMTIGWSKRSDKDVWTRESAKLKSYNIKKDGKVGQREEDTYLHGQVDRERYLPPHVTKFIEDHAPDGMFPFRLNREDVNA